MRIAWCVPRAGFALVCVIMLCVMLAACSSAPAVSLPRSPASSANIAPAQVMSAEQILATTTSIDCTGDTEPIMVAPGWKLIWQRIFDDPIAEPPVIDTSQMLLIERADPRPSTMHDTVLAVDPQTGQTQWSYADANRPEPQLAHKILEILPSSKYWLLLIQHVQPGPVQYEVVIDRQSGQVVYDSGPLAGYPLHSMAISDTALFDHFDAQFLRRVDLPSGTTRWRIPLHIRRPYGLLVLDNRLYLFESGIQLFDPVNGDLIASTALSATLPAEVAVHDSLAIIRNTQVNDQGIEVFDLSRMSSLWVGYLDYRPRQGMRGDLPAMTITSDSIYIFDAQDDLFRISLLTRKVLWQAPAPGFISLARPVVIDGVAYGFYADGTIRAYSTQDGKALGVVARAPIWFWEDANKQAFLDSFGGLGVSGNTLIVTTGCRNVFALQREP